MKKLRRWILLGLLALVLGDTHGPDVRHRLDAGGAAFHRQPPRPDRTGDRHRRERQRHAVRWLHRGLAARTAPARGRAHHRCFGAAAPAAADAPEDRAVACAGPARERAGIPRARRRRFLQGAAFHGAHAGRFRRGTARLHHRPDTDERHDAAWQGHLHRRGGCTAGHHPRARRQVRLGEMHLTADGRVHATDPIGIDGRASSDWHPQGQPAWRFDTHLRRRPRQAAVAGGHRQTLPCPCGWRPRHAHRWLETQRQWQDRGPGHQRVGARAPSSASCPQTSRSRPMPAASRPGAPSLHQGSRPDPSSWISTAPTPTTASPSATTTAVHRPSGTRATIRGTADVVPNGPRLALNGEWTTLQWPLAAAEPAFTSRKGRYTLAGLRPLESPCRRRSDGRRHQQHAGHRQRHPRH